jgi:UDP-glucose 4-epimerase/UDP-glucuronate decarboxylase
MPITAARRILITGGAGFIGYHLARQLATEPGNQIVLVDNLTRGRLDLDLKELLNEPGISFLSADLTDPRSYDLLGKGFDEVYHLAAMIGVRHVLRQPDEVIRVNALSTLYLLEWFTRGGGDRLLFSSTSEAYAWTQKFSALPIPTPEDVPLSLTDLENPRSSYAGSKIFGELAVRQYGALHAKPHAIVRYHNVYGPRMGYDHVIPEIYQRAVGGENPLAVWSINHTRAFCYVLDAVEGTIAALRQCTAPGAVFNLGSDQEEITIGELAQRILSISGIDTVIEPREPNNDPVVRRCPDISRARELLGYVPRYSLNRGLKATIDWYSRRNVDVSCSCPSSNA